MANLHEYVESSSKEGYYLREGYRGDVLTYQLPDFAEKVLVNLDYEDEDRIANEVFYLLLNLGLIYTDGSGVEPVESLDDLPDFDSDKMSSLSPEQRKELLNMLLAHGELPPQQQEELKNYAQERDTDTNTQGKSTGWSSAKGEHNTFNFRIQEYDEYMLAVDRFRLLKPVSERLDMSGGGTESPLLAELETADTRIDVLKKKCAEITGNLRAYRSELGTPQETRLLKKEDLNKNGLAVPTGDGESIVVSYDIPDRDDDIVIPDDWSVPPARPNNNSTDYAEIGLEDLSEKDRKRLLQQAREEVVERINEVLPKHN